MCQFIVASLKCLFMLMPMCLPHKKCLCLPHALLLLLLDSEPEGACDEAVSCAGLCTQLMCPNQ